MMAEFPGYQNQPQYTPEEIAERRRARERIVAGEVEPGPAFNILAFIAVDDTDVITRDQISTTCRLPGISSVS